jgi:hypothetical protein
MKSILIYIFLLINIAVYGQQMSFVQKLHEYTDFNTRHLDFSFFNIDTVNTTADVSITFYFSKKALKYIAHQIQNDTLLDNSIGNNRINDNNKVSFSLQNVSFATIENGLIVNQKCNFISILGEDINKSVKCILLLEKKNFMTFDFYIELHQEHWYYFRYINCVMFSISSNEDYNEIMFNNNLKKYSKKNKNDIYSCYFATKRMTNFFLEKVDSICVKNHSCH